MFSRESKKPDKTIPQAAPVGAGLVFPSLLARGRNCSEFFLAAHHDWRRGRRGELSRCRQTARINQDIVSNEAGPTLSRLALVHV